ncbi:hypothetical protein HK405_003062, partial [Cladochytrium tenue]
MATVSPPPQQQQLQHRLLTVTTAVRLWSVARPPAATTAGAASATSAVAFSHAQQLHSIAPIGNPAATSQQPATLHDVAWSADARCFAACGSPGAVAVYDSASARVVEIVPFDRQLQASSSGGRSQTGAAAGAVARAMAVSFGPRRGSRMLYMAGTNDAVVQWDRKDRAVVNVFSHHGGVVNCLGVNGDETAVVSGSATGEIKMFSLKTNSPVPVRSVFNQ